jgi:hypothetical protein
MIRKVVEHLYLFTVQVRGETEFREVQAYTIQEVAEKLKKKLDDVQYITKVII